MVYLDSSALVKCYLLEKGTPEVIALVSSGEPLYTSILAFAEVISAIARKFREGAISAGERDAAMQLFLKDWSMGLNELPLDRRVTNALPALLHAHPLRASDGVHLGSALWLQQNTPPGNLVFCATDERLLKAAAACGLPIQNPENA